MSYDTLTVDEFHDLFRGRPAFSEMSEWIAEHIGKRYTRTIRLKEGEVDFECIVFGDDGHVRVTPEGNEAWTEWVTVPSHRPPPYWK